MLQFTALNTATGDSRTILAHNIGTAYQIALRYVFTAKTDSVRIYPHCPTYLAVQIAKTVSRKTLSYMETPTQRRIMDCLDRGTAKFNHSLQGTTGDYHCTALFNSYGQQETDSRGTVIKPCLFNADTQDFISIALSGILLCESDNIVDRAGAGFRELNRYIESLRTRQEKEVLTAYDIETDSPVNTEIRRIVKGLTAHEQEQGQGVKDTELSVALQEVSETLTATQQDVFYRLAKGHSLYRVAKEMHRDKKTIKEHRGYIQKKALRNETIRLHLLDNHSPLTYTDIETTAPTDSAWKQENDILCRTTQGGQWAGKNPFAYVAPTAHRESNTAPTAPTIASPVRYRYFLSDEKGNHCGIRYLLTPHSEYRENRQRMYEKLFRLTVIRLTPHSEYREQKQRMYEKLFNAIGESRTEKAPLPVALVLPKHVQIK